MPQVFQFLQGFFWGASTSSHQVEGGLSNDWTDWESSSERAEYLRTTGELEKYGLENFISGKGVEHQKFFKEDLQLAKKLGHTATRFSIEWSRIEPEEGKFDEEALQYYRKVIQECRRLGIEPFVTLWHWTLPLWIRDRGGWEKKKTVEYFVRYVERVMSVLGSEVRFWITLNEPDLYAKHAYQLGVWPPQQKSISRYLVVMKNLIVAHCRAYDVIHHIKPDAQVGIAKNNSFVDPQPATMLNRVLASTYDWWHNRLFLNRIADKQDFIGLNHYFHERFIYGKVRNENAIVSDLGWELYPEAIYHALKNLKKYQQPIIITENGLADATDEKRSWFILESLKYVHCAIQEGVDVRGYLHWSLLDNFEWDKGFWPKFGLIAVDKDMKRTPRPSSFVYRDICLHNGFDEDVLERYQLKR